MFVCVCVCVLSTLMLDVRVGVFADRKSWCQQREVEREEMTAASSRGSGLTTETLTLLCFSEAAFLSLMKLLERNESAKPSQNQLSILSLYVVQFLSSLFYLTVPPVI